MCYLRYRPARGFTLVELMITVALSGVILSALYQIFITQRRSYSLQNEMVELQQELRACECMMVREIRMAGYKVPEVRVEVDVPGVLFTNGEMELFEETAAHSIAFTSDVDGDGVVETIRYCLKETSLMREMWRWDASKKKWGKSGGPRAVSDHIERLDFRYFILADDEGLNNDQDDDGDLYSDEEGELLITDEPRNNERVHLRSVQLTLTVKSATPDARYRDPLNGDHYRRRVFSSTIQPRNMGL